MGSMTGSVDEEKQPLVKGDLEKASLGVKQDGISPSLQLLLQQHKIPLIILYYGLCSSTLIVINKVAVHNITVRAATADLLDACLCLCVMPCSMRPLLVCMACQAMPVNVLIYSWALVHYRCTVPVCVYVYLCVALCVCVCETGTVEGVQLHTGCFQAAAAFAPPPVCLPRVPRVCTHRRLLCADQQAAELVQANKQQRRCCQTNLHLWLWLALVPRCCLAHHKH